MVLGDGDPEHVPGHGDVRGAISGPVSGWEVGSPTFTLTSDAFVEIAHLMGWQGSVLLETDFGNTVVRADNYAGVSIAVEKKDPREAMLAVLALMVAQMKGKP